MTEVRGLVLRVVNVSAETSESAILGGTHIAFHFCGRIAQSCFMNPRSTLNTPHGYMNNL